MRGLALIDRFPHVLIWILSSALEAVTEDSANNDNGTRYSLTLSEKIAGGDLTRMNEIAVSISGKRFLAGL